MKWHGTAFSNTSYILGDYNKWKVQDNEEMSGLFKGNMKINCKLTVVSLLTTSIECSDISMFTKTEKYLTARKVH